MSDNLLEVSGLMMRFGGLLAVDNVSLQVKPRQIHSVIGPNGAGKTTVFNCISGFYSPSGGAIRYAGKAIQGLTGHRISRLGLVRTFQHVRLFSSMTVIENLLVAQHRHLNTNYFAGLLKTPSYRRREQEAMERATSWLRQVGLLEQANREAGNLSYGQQRRLEIARCMVTEPGLLMLDEPAAGLNPRETSELDQLILRLRDEQDIAVLLIEHDMGLVMGISDHITVINQGAPLADGTPEQILANPDVIKAYLGES
ncbi:MAG: high-affinity branched-chain amino acid ABC transporter ATP-binding protein LivG [Oceanospirillales bacterium]|uniref:L-leucine ABC transporter ATP-binding protein /L-isoleucine ABC transporter ATP-binding protein /L-valine ABC transporter ATP-binding protein n=1 Tax=Marinobacterium halophilum TaxID=267374 RepID=A0A2P8EQV5_9GAMM|nr:high-affinity branched-chain amino acid ABC transporter ATP-binding protein LivG [Marinobacterium halophilum]MBR9829075.1 high-affinity branched-chain amino acid ABC transporter ATP-binding protein LivG [Oceanospirillales bacterium]PSL11833.1 L-leucine ABC transporter ATP-binding protein /L-isoleucine ABC transporter ATP-binding protein /L-valine ABC transporter ATP-binding protein [Marinobacterium halophilum]